MGEFESIISKCKKDWQCPDLMESVNKISGKKIPFSSPSLNFITYGGIPRAAVTMFYGVPGGGKSTTAMDNCKQAMELFNSEYTEEVAQLEEKVNSGKKEFKPRLLDLKDRGPKKVLYVDLEHSFDRKWAAKLGIDYSNNCINVMQPPNVAAEKILQVIEDLISTNEIGLIVVDSIPSLVTQAELDKKYGERTVASLAGLLTIFMRKITQLLIRYDCTMLLINQQRVNMDNPYVDNIPGGEALRFYSSLIMSFKLGNPVDLFGNELAQKAENPAGYKIDVRVKKQKTAPYDRKLGQYYLMTQSGLRVDFEIANLAITQYNMIRKNGGWFTMCDPTTKESLEVDDVPVKLNGIAKVYDYLNSHPDYYRSLYDFIVNDINDAGMDVTPATSDAEFAFEDSSPIPESM